MKPLIIVSLRHQAILVPDSLRDLEAPFYLRDNTGILCGPINNFTFFNFLDLLSNSTSAVFPMA